MTHRINHVDVPRLKVALCGYALIVLGLIVVAEATLAFLPVVMSSVNIRSAFMLGRLFYTRPAVTRDEYNHYLAVRDPTLGWPGQNDSATTTILDESGARRSPAFPKPGHECVSLYGDSFTFGEEVSDAEAWGNILAESLNCRVANFGVSGYGTDQALLRFKKNTFDSAPVTVLGIFGDDLRRNVNQYYYFLTGAEASKFALKPRFVVESGSLKLIPIPTLSFEEFQQALNHPETVWHYETFLPGGSYGPTVWSFPYTLSLWRLLTSPYFLDLVTKWTRSENSWIDFFRTNHSSKALQTTVAIVDEFRRVAAQRDSTVLVVMFPSSTTFHSFRRTGVSPFSPLIAALKRRGVRTIDLTEHLANYLKGRDPCEISLRECAGHLTPEGNRVVAGIVQKSVAVIAGNRRHGSAKSE
jgi:hypothetical protein